MRVNLSLDEDSFDAAFDALEEKLDQITRGLVVTFWEKVLLETPQYWGRMAASWNFTMNTSYGIDRSNMVVFDPINDTPRQKGHREGIQIADAYARDTVNSFKLGDVAYMTNAVDHGEGPYAQDMEAGRIKVRDVNIPSNMVMQALAMVDAKFSRGIDAITAKQLMDKKL